MDPLSITTGVLTITTRCITVGIQIYSTWNYYRDAPQTVADLVDEIQIVHASLTQLQHVLRLEGFSITSDLEHVFGIAVKGCKATLLCLEEEFRTLQGRSDWRARIKVLWKDDIMTTLLEQLGRRKTSIMLLMQCLHLESNHGTRRLLQQHRPELQRAKEDFSTLVVSYPQLAAPLIETLDRDTVASIVGSRDSILSTTEFCFDQEIVNTRVYRENMARLAAKARSRGGRMSDDESTIRAPSPAKDSSPASGVAAPEIVEDLIDLSNDFVPASNPATPLFVHPDLESLKIGSANLTNVEPMVHTLVSEQNLEQLNNPGEPRETNVDGSLIPRSLEKFPNDETLEIWDNLDDDPFSSSAKKFSGNDTEYPYDGTLLKSPLYDAPSEKGVDRISSKDVLAMMEHPTTRDAQHRARDTEVLVNLVRSAAEMRNSFEQMKKYIQEQDALIDKLNKDVPGVTGGPPQLLSGQRPQEQQPLAANTILEQKRRNVFKRALKVLSSKSDSDTVKIEQMMMQSLDQVEALKAKIPRKLADHSQEALPDIGGESESIHAFEESQKLQAEGKLTISSPYGTSSIVDTATRITAEPVPARQNLGAIRTPKMIMKQRRERESRRQAEADAVRDAVAKSTDFPGPVPPQSATDSGLAWRGKPLPIPTFPQPKRDPSLPLWEKLVPSKNLSEHDYQSEIPPDTGVIINHSKRGSDRKMNDSDSYAEEKVRRMKIRDEDGQSAGDAALAAAGIPATALGRYESEQRSRRRERNQKQILVDEQTAKKMAPNIGSGTIPRQSRSLDKERIIRKVMQKPAQKPLVGGCREDNLLLISDSPQDARRISANMETDDTNGAEGSTSHAHVKRSRSNTPVTLLDTHTVSTINDPKLLVPVEDAIRRLILPTLNALKEEQRDQRYEQRKRSKAKLKPSKADSALSSSTITNDINSRLGSTAFPAQSIEHTLGALHSASREASRQKVSKARVITHPVPAMDSLDKQEESPLYSRENPYTPIEAKRDPELRSPQSTTPDSSGSPYWDHPGDTPPDAEPFWGNMPFLNPNAQDNPFMLATDAAPDDSLSTKAQRGGTRARTKIEYFEGSKQKTSRPARRSPIRVRVTPSKKREQNGVQITESKSRKLSLARIPPLPGPTGTESVDRE